jgi:hypothetical protein
MQNAEIKIWNLQSSCGIARKDQLIDQGKGQPFHLQLMLHHLGSSIMPVSQLSDVYNIKILYVSHNVL